MKRFALLIVLFFLLFQPASAHANQTELTWERSQMQQIEVDAALSVQIYTLTLLGSGESIEFNLSNQQSADGRALYQLLIPTSFPLDSYVIKAEMSDGTYKDLAIVRVVEYQSENYNPLTDPETVHTLAIALFALLTVWNISDRSQGKSDEYADDQTTLDSFDTTIVGRSIRGSGLSRKGLLSSIYLDQIRSTWSISTNRFSPLLSRITSDGAYLQYSLGVGVLAFPIAGALLGALAFQDIEGNGGITTPAVSIVMAILILSALDASAGLGASVVFGLTALSSNRFGNVYDLRTFMGLTLLWISPSLVANATRTLRRSRADSDGWERLADVVLGSLITGWAIKTIVISLDGFAHLKLPLHSHAQSLGIASGLAIAVRYLLEGYVSGKNQYYLAYLSPKILHQQSPNWRLIGWFVKGSIFLFFTISFLGMTWHLWAGVAMVMFPVLAKTVKEKLPNSTILFQLIPVGLPALLFMIFVGKVYTPYINSLDLDPETATRTLFVLAGLPGLVISSLKLFGRSPSEGDTRWYLREKMRSFYRITGALFALIYITYLTGLAG